MSKNKEVYSHFIQKALVKNFANNGIVKYIKYPNGKIGSFSIKDLNSKQPVAIKGFYSNDIETGMNNLENKGINVIRKIAKTAQFDEEVSLNREELISLRFYLVLSGVRTNKLRNNILNRTGDSLFNEAIQEAKDNPKNIQEKMIKCILKYWESNKKEITDNFLMEISKYENDKVKKLCLVNIFNIINSRLLIFKFKSNNLLLSETTEFTEENKLSGGTLLDFMPIFSNIGIAFYYDPIRIRGSDLTMQKSKIFKNDISFKRHKNKYVNFEIMIKQQQEYLKNSKNINKDNKIFWEIEKKKYNHKNDQYIYEVLEEPKESAILCNSMALVHCKDSYVIFQNKNDIKQAEKYIVEKGIIRIEDYQ